MDSIAGYGKGVGQSFQQLDKQSLRRLRINVRARFIGWSKRGFQLLQGRRDLRRRIARKCQACLNSKRLLYLALTMLGDLDNPLVFAHAGKSLVEHAVASPEVVQCPLDRTVPTKDLLEHAVAPPEVVQCPLDRTVPTEHLLEHAVAPPEVVQCPLDHGVPTEHLVDHAVALLEVVQRALDRTIPTKHLLEHAVALLDVT